MGRCKYLRNMITYRPLTPEMAGKLAEIDRSESIDKIYTLNEGALFSVEMHCECSSWDAVALKEVQERFRSELQKGGMGIGAFKEDALVGFGVLAHAFIGAAQDQLQVDLLYVSRNFRRKGIGKSILQMLSEEAKKRGAKALYISSTETRSAVSFYMGNGAAVTAEVDKVLFEKEPTDIHMLKKLE